MNAFQTCRNTTDAVPLYLQQQLYLKPAARINVSLQLPNVKKQAKSISHWEIMDKLRTAIRPDEFSVLKVSKTTVEFVRFEAELDNKSRLDKVVSKLDNNLVKLKDFAEPLRVKAAIARSDFPTRHSWDTFFSDSREMDDMKPGERPDTIHLSNMPIKWFVLHHSMRQDDDTFMLPSEKILFRIFDKFGAIRHVDVPICDPYRKKMKEQISGLKAHPFDDKDFFEGYVQFKDYIGFTKAMDALRDMKLLRKEDDEAISVSIKVDFDRSKHLTDASIRRREIVRDRLIRKERDREEREKNELNQKKHQEQHERQKQIDLKNEKVKRRKEREEKRKAKILENLKIKSCGDINEKIAEEEKKLLKVQRKLEAIRIVEELFRRIKDKKNVAVDPCPKIRNSYNNNELNKLKNTSELEVITQRQKLHSAIEGRIVLKNILSKSVRTQSDYSSSSSDLSTVSNTRNKNNKDKNYGANRNENNGPPEMFMEPEDWYGYPPYQSYPPMRPHPATFLMYPQRARGGHRGMAMPGTSRGSYPRRQRGGYRPRYRGGYRGDFNQRYPPDLEEEYFKYFSKFLTDRQSTNNNKRTAGSNYSSDRSRSRSRSRRRTRSYSRSRRSYSRSSRRSHRSRSRSYRTKSRSRSKSRHSRRSSSRSYTPKAKSRSRSVDSSAFVSRGELQSRSQSSPVAKSKEKRHATKSKSPEGKI